MESAFIEKQREKLIEQRTEILATISGRNEQVARLAEYSEPGDDVDIASDTIDRKLLNQLGEQETRRLTLMNNALDRIKQGKYGLCLICGKSIPEARLEAIPYAALCVACQTKEERRNR